MFKQNWKKMKLKLVKILVDIGPIGFNWLNCNLNVDWMWFSSFKLWFQILFKRKLNSVLALKHGPNK